MNFLKNRKASVSFIFITILMDAIGLGLIIPSLPEVIKRFNTSPDFINQYFGYFISIYALMQFMASPLLGALSDKFGRRPVLLISLLGSGLDYLMMAFAPTLFLLFLGRIFSGITGANHTVAGSYMADISTDETRAQNFGMIGAAWGVGFIAGPAIGGLLHSYGASAPFLAAAFFSLLNFFFGLFVLPESLPKESRRNLDLKKLNPFQSIFNILKPSSISILIFIDVLLNLAGQVHPSLWTLYTQTKYNWSVAEVGVSLAFVGITIGITQGGLTRVIIPRIGEKNALGLGILCYAFEFIAIAFATKGWMMYPILTVFSISGVAMHALQSMITKNIPSNEQGELQGTLMSLASLTSIIGPLFYTQLFNIFTKPNAPFYFSGSAYLSAGIVSLVSLFLFQSYLKKHSA